MSETEELIEQLKAVSTGRDTFRAAILAKSAVNSVMAFLCRADRRYDVEDLPYVQRMTLPPVCSFIAENQLASAFEFVGTVGAHANQGRAVTKKQAQLAVEHALGILATVRTKIEPGAPACVFSKSMSEAETRKEYIDLYLSEAGWELVGQDGSPIPGKAATEIEVTGMPPHGQLGYCDYVLYGRDGKPVAVVEAKKTSLSPDKGREQVKLYGERLVAMYGCEMPVLYYTNGYTIWCMDGVYPDRPLHAFHTEQELGVLMHLRQRAPMPKIKVNTGVPEGYSNGFKPAWVEDDIQVAPAAGCDTWSIWKELYLAIREGKSFRIKLEEAREVVRMTELVKAGAIDNVRDRKF